jgi:hypothetical protein
MAVKVGQDEVSTRLLVSRNYLKKPTPERKSVYT